MCTEQHAWLGPISPSVEKAVKSHTKSKKITYSSILVQYNSTGRQQ